MTPKIQQRSSRICLQHVLQRDGAQLWSTARCVRGPEETSLAELGGFKQVFGNRGMS